MKLITGRELRPPSQHPQPPHFSSQNTNPKLPRFCLECRLIAATPFAALAVRLWRYALRVQCQRHDPTRRWSHQNYHHWINGGGAHGVTALGKDRNSCAVANGGSRNERIRTTGCLLYTSDAADDLTRVDL